MVTLFIIALVIGIIILGYGCCVDVWKFEHTGLILISGSLICMLITIFANCDVVF